jgi:hypothetical protein
MMASSNIPHANVCKAVREGYRVLTIRGLARKYGLSEKTVRYILNNPNPDDAPPAKPTPTKSASQVQRDLDRREAKTVEPTNPGPQRAVEPMGKPVSQIQREIDTLEEQAQILGMRTPEPSVEPKQVLYQTPYTRDVPTFDPMQPALDPPSQPYYPGTVTVNPAMPQPQPVFRTTYRGRCGYVASIQRSGPTMRHTARGTRYDLWDPQVDGDLFDPYGDF